MNKLYIQFFNYLIILNTWTIGDVVSWANASKMLTLVFKWCDDPIPPTCLCKYPRAKECPVRLGTSLAQRRRSKLVWASIAVNLESETAWAIRPTLSAAATRRIVLPFVNAF